MATDRAAYMRAWRARNPEYMKRQRRIEQERTANRVGPAPKRPKHSTNDPAKDAIYTAVKKALRDGLLTKEPCLFCGSDRVEAHHHDYSKPLEVTWLCRAHHRLIHRKDPW